MRALLVLLLLPIFSCDHNGQDSRDGQEYPITIHATIKGYKITYDSTGVIDSTEITDRRAIDTMLIRGGLDYLYPDSFVFTNKRTVFSKFPTPSPYPDYYSRRSPLNVVDQDSVVCFYDVHDASLVRFSFKNDPPRLIGHGHFIYTAYKMYNGISLGQGTWNFDRSKVPVTWENIYRITLLQYDVSYEL